MINAFWAFISKPSLFRTLMLDDITGDERARMNEAPTLQDEVAFVENVLRMEKLNASQGAAILHALRHHCTLIQRPPGTGKSYINKCV